ARPSEARSLLPALLAGAWIDIQEGDRTVISKLAQVPYEEVSRTLVRWVNEADPPIRRIGNTWFLVSKEDAWFLLARYLTWDDLERLEKVVLDVLNTPDPHFDLPTDQRWMANVLGHAPQHSNLLRENLANTLAIMGSRGETTRTLSAASTQDYALRIVGQILN